MGFGAVCGVEGGTLVAFMQPKAQLLPVLAPHLQIDCPGRTG